MAPTSNDLHSRRVYTDSRAYFTVPRSIRPREISQSDWNRLSALNDYIIDRVSYDHDRAVAIRTGDPSIQVHHPKHTITSGRGVCMDYAALFEHLAGKMGYKVTSITSTKLNHAWNAVALGGKWWIVDVTWNDGEDSVSGRKLPKSVRNDPDYRRKYFLINRERERFLYDRKILSRTHRCPDAKPISYRATLKAHECLDELRPVLEQYNQSVKLANDIVPKLNHLSAVEGRLVRDHNAEESPRRRQRLAARIDSTRREYQQVAALHRQRTEQMERLDRKVDVLYGKFTAIQSRYPIALSYTIRGR